MMHLVPFRVAHIESISDPETEPGLKAMLPPHYWREMEASGTAFSAFAYQEFLGCGGYAQPWEGTAHCWIWDTPAVHKYPLAVHKLIVRAIRYLEQDCGVWRISCDVRCGNARAERWVELLGFRKEASMKKFGPDGSDFSLYARIT